MELKDVIHYYIGAKCKIVNDADIWYMTGVENRMFRTEIYAFTQDLHTSFDLDKVTPILRRIDSLTDEECISLAALSELPEDFVDPIVSINKLGDKIVTWGASVKFNCTGELFYCAEQFKYLLSLHIDLFSLIDAGLAVDEATIK